MDEHVKEYYCRRNMWLTQTQIMSWKEYVYLMFTTDKRTGQRP